MKNRYCKYCGTESKGTNFRTSAAKCIPCEAGKHNNGFIIHPPSSAVRYEVKTDLVNKRRAREHILAMRKIDEEFEL